MMPSYKATFARVNIILHVFMACNLTMYSQTTTVAIVEERRKNTKCRALSHSHSGYNNALSVYSTGALRMEMHLAWVLMQHFIALTYICVISQFILTLLAIMHKY